jgi:PAS domain S-box-containing protein
MGVIDRFFDLSPDLLGLLDGEGRIRKVNCAWCRALGLTRDDVEGHLFASFVHPIDRAAMVQRLAGLGRDGRTALRCRIVSESGADRSIAWSLDASGHDGLVYAHGRDLADRRSGESALSSEQFLRALIDAVPSAVFVYANDVCVLSNEASGRLFGTRKDDDARVSWKGFELADREAFRAENRLVVADGRSVFTPEHKVVTPDGETRWFQVRKVPIALPDGELGVLGVAEDITERRNTEAALRRSEAQLRELVGVQARVQQANRMLSIGTLAAGVAHEINNPLAYVLANLSQLTEQLPAITSALRSDPSFDPASITEIERMIAETREGATRVKEIVSDLKTLSRPEDERKTAVDVRPVIDSTIQIAWNEIRHRAQLTKDYTEVPTVSANESRLAQVFLNLLLNAAQAIPEGHAATNEITVRVFADGPNVIIDVADTGCGIPEDVRGRIFDPFFTTKPVGEGTGLGLSICHGIVTALGGCIRVESNMKRGSTFRVELPASAEREATKSIEPPRSARRLERKVSILIVDDEPTICRAIGRMLKERCAVSTATSGREALERVTQEGSFDLILCDLMMPDVTGAELFETVRAVRPEMADRFVFMTGGAFTPRAREFLAGVPNPSLDKPIEPKVLRKMVDEIIGR